MSFYMKRFSLDFDLPFSDFLPVSFPMQFDIKVSRLFGYLIITVKSITWRMHYCQTADSYLSAKLLPICNTCRRAQFTCLEPVLCLSKYLFFPAKLQASNGSLRLSLPKTNTLLYVLKEMHENLKLADRNCKPLKTNPFRVIEEDLPPTGKGQAPYVTSRMPSADV